MTIQTFPQKRKSEYYGKIDNLHLSYDGNRLTEVVEDAAAINRQGAFDFNPDQGSGVAYTYNSAGALTSDAHRGISTIDYDLQGHPEEMMWENGNSTSYVYTASGTKLRTVHSTAMPGLSIPSSETSPLSPREILHRDSTDLYGDVVYENGRASMLLFDGGYATFEDDGMKFHYFTRDYLGSVRAVVDGDDGSVEQFTSYYAFGGPIPELSTQQDVQPYKYNGKEFDRHHGLDLYDHGARRYDPIIPRWITIDPLCEKAYHVSPYFMCNGNPITNYDRDGRFPTHATARLDKAESILRFDYPSVIIYNPNAKNPNNRYYYTISDVIDDVPTITAHNSPRKGFAHLLQNLGDGTQVVGYAVTIVDPVHGAPIISIGGAVSDFGTGYEAFIDFLNEEGNTTENITKILGEKLLLKLIQKRLPGANDSFRPIENMDAGNTILLQSANVKIIIIDRTAEAYKNKRAKENNNNEDSDENVE